MGVEDGVWFSENGMWQVWVKEWECLHPRRLMIKYHVAQLAHLSAPSQQKSFILMHLLAEVN